MSVGRGFLPRAGLEFRTRIEVSPTNPKRDEMTESPSDDRGPVDRRRFFREGLARLVNPVARIVQDRLPISLPVTRVTLRPPGALIEAEFLDTCFRCGSCADACPANAIALMQSREERLQGTPYVDPDRQACVICDDLACMKACPSGALRRVDRFEIRMGLAEVNHDLCVRSRGENCRICVERCPLGDVAIGVESAGRIAIIDPDPSGKGCTGCGVCQQYCPTKPARAITIVPV